MECTKCRRANPAGARFCNQCGAPLQSGAAADSPPIQLAPSEGVRCPRCGSSVSAGARFCTRCGAGVAVRESVAPPSRQRVAPPSETARPSVASPSWILPVGISVALLGFLMFVLSFVIGLMPRGGLPWRQGSADSSGAAGETLVETPAEREQRWAREDAEIGSRAFGELGK